MTLGPWGWTFSAARTQPCSPVGNGVWTTNPKQVFLQRHKESLLLRTWAKTFRRSLPHRISCQVLQTCP